MANIPDYQALGPETAPLPARRIPEPDLSGEILAQAGAELGRSVERFGLDVADRQEKDRIQRVNLARAKAGNAMVDHQISVQQAAETTREGIASGDIPYESARQHFNDAVAAIPPPEVPNLDPVGKENLNKGLIRNIATTGFMVDAVVDTARRQDFRDQFATNLNLLDKQAGMPGADIEQINAQAEAFRPLARKAGIPAVEVDKAIQGLKDSNWFNHANQRAMLAKDNWNQLKALETDLTSKEGFYAGRLDTNKRNEVLRSVVNDELILQNRWEHEHDRREAKAGSAMRQAGEMISSTIPLSAKNWADLGAQVQGTSYEAEFSGLQQNEEKVQQVLRMPPTEQANFLQQEGAKLDTAQSGTISERLQARANFERLQGAFNQNQKLMTDTPLLWSANRNGTEVPPIDFQGLASDEGQAKIGAELADRMATLRALREKNGPQIGIKPLLPPDAAQFTSYLQSIAPRQRALTLSALRRAAPDDETYSAMMDQIAPHSPVTAIAGAMVGQSTPAHTPVWFNPAYAPKLDDAQLVMQGEALLNPALGSKEQQAEIEKGGGKPAQTMPADAGPNGLRSIFGRAASDMFRDRLPIGEDYFSVFKAAYAALLERSGNMKGLPESTLQRRALTIALGATRTFRGNQVSVPAGMDPGAFDAIVERAVAQEAANQKAPADWTDRLRGYQLVELGRTLGSGRYGITVGGMPMVNPNGKGYFAIDLKGQYDPARGAKPSSARAAVSNPPEGYLYDPVSHTFKPDPSIDQAALQGSFR